MELITNEPWKFCKKHV